MSTGCRLALILRLHQIIWVILSPRMIEICDNARMPTTCEIIEGNLPSRQTRLVLAWADLHQEELTADWHLVTNGEQPFKIEPLR